MSRIRANQITNQSADGAPTVQNGLVISGVTTSTNVSVASSVTATTYYGSGANLTNITSTTINNNADNRLITGSGTANTLEGEANLTYDGSTLSVSGKISTPLGTTTRVGVADRISGTGAGGSLLVTGGAARGSGQTSGDLLLATGRGNNSASTGTIKFGYNNGADGTSLDHEWLRIGTNGSLSINYAGDGDNTLHIGCTSNAGGIILKAPGNHYANIVTDCNRSGANNGILNLAGRWNGNDVAYISFTTGTDTSNKDDGYIRMYTRESGQSLTERVQIKEAGGFVSNNGGGNIAFSDGYSAIEARAPEGTTQLTVTNTTYESGTFDNEAGIWFKGNYSGNNERAKSAIIHKNTGDYGVGDLYFCLDGTGDNSNATVSDVKMKINSSGQVTKPSQASFAAYHNQNAFSLNNQVFPFNTTKHNIGNHFNTSNYRFTAPVDGRYLFNFHSIYNSNGQQDVQIRVNNSASRGMMFHVSQTGGNWDLGSCSYLLDLNANDYVTMWSVSNTGWHGNNWGMFSGELLS